MQRQKHTKIINENFIQKIMLCINCKKFYSVTIIQLVLELVKIFIDLYELI